MARDFAQLDPTKNTWTIAWRNPRANRFVRAINWTGTWAEAVAMAGVFGEANPQLQVWYTGSVESEAAGWVHAEDCGNILVDSGRRVRIVDTGEIPPRILASHRFAGQLYAPADESAELRAARMGTARTLADAEAWARSVGITFEWRDDWEIGSHVQECGPDSAYADGEPDSCEECIMRDALGNVLGALACIDDADDDYRRLIEAQLAVEPWEQAHDASA